MAIAGHLGEALSCLIDRHRSVVDLTSDRSLEHGRVDEGGFGISVSWRVTARPVFDEYSAARISGVFGVNGVNSDSWFMLVCRDYYSVATVTTFRRDAE